MVRLSIPSQLGLTPLAVLVLAGAAATTTACGRSVDVATSLQVTDVVSGWFDAGVAAGKNKLVPSVSFKVKNVSPSPVSSVQFNAVFRVIDDPEELGSMLVKGIDARGLAPGASTPDLVLQSSLGYTGEQTRLEMLQHSAFRDAQVEIFAKHGSRQWVKLGQYKIERQLLTTNVLAK